MRGRLAINFQFLRNNPQFIYGVVLIILIPAAIIFNTLFFRQSITNVLDTELNQKALLSNEIFSGQVVETLSDRVKLQNLLTATAKRSDEIRGLDVLIPSGDYYEVVASLDSAMVGKVSKRIYNSIAWTRGESIAYQTFSSARSTEDQLQRGSERFWVVVTPISQPDGTKVGILSMKISSQTIDTMITQSLNRSLLVLFATILVIILLQANNIRLFQYVNLARKLKEVDKMKDEFISMASHELRAPIVGIRGYLQMTLDKSFGELPPEAEAKIRMVFEESNRLHDLVEDLLNVSRIEQGRVTLDLQPLDLQPLVSVVMDTFKQQADDKQIALAAHITTPLPRIVADESKLKEIMVNLISNAIKYTPKGTVTLSADVKQDKEPMVKIVISDTGLGMSAKDREHIFEKFYRIRNEQTDKITGTGLGLWITRELVRLMKGDIYIDSIEGVGTHVTLLLPVARDQK